MNILFYLQRLIGSVGGDEIGRQVAMELRHFRIDRRAEFGDLVLIMHINGDGTEKLPPRLKWNGIVQIVARRRAYDE